MTFDANIDSREGFDAATEAEYNEYFDATETEVYYDDATECEYEFDDDGQPDEYTEWQDYMGGDDWDHGQYDDCGGEW